MPRPRIPTEKAKLTGAFATNPGRFAGREELDDNRPFGGPPPHLDALAQTLWMEFGEEWPWLRFGDRKAMEPVVLLFCKIRNGDAGTNEFKEFRMMCNSFGGNPTTRTKIHMPKPDEPTDPFDELMARN